MFKEQNLIKIYISMFLWIVGFLFLLTIFNSWVLHNYWIIICSLSIVLYIGLSITYKTNSLISIGSFVFLYFILFFVVRGLQLTIWPQSDTLINLSRYDLNNTLSWISIAMIVFTIVYFTSKVPFLKIPIMRKETHGAFNGSLLIFLSILTTCFAFSGLFILFKNYGGLSGLYLRFASHAKDFDPSSVDNFGIMFWTSFYSWSVWLWALTYSCAKYNKRIIGTIFGFILILYLSISTFLFGSRTYILTIVFGVAVIYHWRIHNISNRILLLGLPLGAFFSFWVVNYRTSGTTGFTAEGIFNNLGHSVLDVMLAIVAEPLPKSILTNSERWLQLPVALIPRIIWPSKPNIIFTRLDWMVAFFYNGKGRTINAGNPPSIFGEWFIYGDWFLVIIAIIVFGVICGVIDRWISENKMNPLSFLVYLPVATSLVTYFKDGDVVLFLITLIKSLIIGIVFIQIFLIANKKKWKLS